MIRIAIIAVIVAVGVIMFMPQTAAMFPSVDSVIGTATSDISSVLGSVVDYVGEAMVGSVASSIGGAIEAATTAPTEPPAS